MRDRKTEHHFYLSDLGKKGPLSRPPQIPQRPLEISDKEKKWRTGRIKALRRQIRNIQSELEELATKREEAKKLKTKVAMEAANKAKEMEAKEALRKEAAIKQDDTRLVEHTEKVEGREAKPSQHSSNNLRKSKKLGTGLGQLFKGIRSRKKDPTQTDNFYPIVAPDK